MINSVVERPLELCQEDWAVCVYYWADAGQCRIVCVYFCSTLMMMCSCKYFSSSASCVFLTAGPLANRNLLSKRYRYSGIGERGVTSGVSKVFPGKRRLKLSRVSKPCIFD